MWTTISKFALKLLSSKEGRKLLKTLALLLLVILLIPAAAIAYLFPWKVSAEKDDPYIEAARMINGDVINLDDIRIIDMVVFFDGDAERMSQVTTQSLTNRYYKYYYSQASEDDEDGFAFSSKRYFDIIESLEAAGLITSEKEKRINEFIEIAQNVDPALYDSTSVSITKGDITLPFNKYTITAGSWAYADGGWHPAVDFAVPLNTSIKAPMNFTKLTEGITNSGYGTYTVMLAQKEQDAYVFIFGHMNKVYVKQSYLQGEVIGLSGNTGNSTGPHTHIEVIFLKNKTSTEVSALFKKNKDYWFGLGYTKKGECSKICRLKPENVFGVKLGEVRR